MIKIIKEGTRKEHTCKKCGCLFSYEAEDVTTKNGINWCQKFVICPQCRNEIILEGTR